MKKIVLFAIVAGLLSFNARANRDPELEARVAVQLKAQHPGAARQQAEIAGPAEKLSQQGGVCAATLSQDGQVLHLLVPRFIIDGASYFASFKVVQASDGSFITTVDGFGAMNRSDCFDSDTGILITPDNKYLLHIPSLMLGADRLWVNLEQVPTPDGTVALKVIAAGKAATGVTGEGSAYLSLARFSASKISATQSRARESFFGGTEAEVTLTLLENQTYTPSEEEAAAVARLGIKVYGTQFTHSETADTAQTRTQYFVPQSALSRKMAKQSKAGPPGEMNGTRVVLESSIRGAGKEAVERMAEKGFHTAGKNAAKGVFSVMDVVSAWDTRTEHLDSMQRLDAAQNCVENPDAVTVQLFTQHPEERQKRLDAINEARTDLKINTGNRFVTTIAGGVLDALEGLLAPLSGGATGFVDDATKYNNDAVVERVENYVGKCAKKAYKVDYSFAGGRISGTICTGRTFTLNYDGGGFIAGFFGCTVPEADAGTCEFVGELNGAPCTYDNGVNYRIARDVQGPVSILINLQAGNMTCTVPTGRLVIPTPGSSITAPLTLAADAMICN